MDVIMDIRGCYLIVKGILHEEEVTLMNVYWPPGHSSDFLTFTAFSKLADFEVKRLFIGGDFNCHLNPIMDKLPRGKLSLSFEYVDVWRAHHPMEREYTFFSKVHNCYTTIDFFPPENYAGT